MIESLPFIKAAACAAIFWRLFTYDWPKHSRYRIGMTAVAVLVMFLVGAQAISLSLGIQWAAPFFDVGIYLAFLILVMAARGNIAKILEIRHV